MSEISKKSRRLSPQATPMGEVVLYPAHAGDSSHNNKARNVIGGVKPLKRRKLVKTAAKLRFTSGQPLIFPTISFRILPILTLFTPSCRWVPPKGNFAKQNRDADVVPVRRSALAKAGNRATKEFKTSLVKPAHTRSIKKGRFYVGFRTMPASLPLALHSTIR